MTAEPKDDESISRATSHYPPAEITPAEFEEFVTTLFDAAKSSLPGIQVRLHDVVEGMDGAYDFDVTARYEVAGMEFFVLVEAKRHKHPIKRELVQVLHDKLRSVGARKAVMVSTAPYQSGAVAYALKHGIALVTVTEGRFTYETKSAREVQAPSREQANKWFGLPTFVGHAYSPVRKKAGSG